MQRRPLAFNYSASAHFPPVADPKFDGVNRGSMKSGVSKALLASLLLAVPTWPSVGHTAAARGMKPAGHEVHFRDDDLRTRRMAIEALGKVFSEEKDASPGVNWLGTAWVNVSAGAPPDLFVMYGCSPTGNCGLYGYQRSNGRWRLVLDSIAQSCSILPSSHGGRRDISAYMHGSADEGTLKTYWWHRNRYMRVSERNLIFK